MARFRERPLKLRKSHHAHPSSLLLPETLRKETTDYATRFSEKKQGSAGSSADSCRLEGMKRKPRMQEKEASIGLSWAPKVPMPSGGKDTSVDSLSLPETSIWKPDCELVDGLYVPPREPKKLNKLLKKSMKDTTGKNWFDMPAPVVTPELKMDLEILKLRSFIDPKKHFKKGDKSKAPPKYFQVGTVVEPASEFYSGRLTKKERKSTLADELLSDGTFRAYRKRKVEEINESRRPGGVAKWKIQGKTTWKRAGERRRG